jgi:hypothetical protein
MPDRGAEIIALDKQRMDAMVAQDVATMEKLIADDLVYTHSSARIDTKQSLIGNMKSGSTVYTQMEPSDVAAQDLGDAVVLTGTAKVTVQGARGEMKFGIRFIDVYANRGGQWQMVAWQSTRTPD